MSWIQFIWHNWKSFCLFFAAFASLLFSTIVSLEILIRTHSSGFLFVLCYKNKQLRNMIRKWPIKVNVTWNLFSVFFFRPRFFFLIQSQKVKPITKIILMSWSFFKLNFSWFVSGHHLPQILTTQLNRSIPLILSTHDADHKRCERVVSRPKIKTNNFTHKCSHASAWIVIILLHHNWAQRYAFHFDS